jgi:hypothetical protein
MPLVRYGQLGSLLGLPSKQMGKRQSSGDATERP